VSEARRERKVVTVLFADLVGFTTQSEQLGTIPTPAS
jgi:class 3 adenylate cyclase